MWYWHGGFYKTEQLTSLKASGGNTPREPRESSGSLHSVLSAGAPGRRQGASSGLRHPLTPQHGSGAQSADLAEAVEPACCGATARGGAAEPGGRGAARRKCGLRGSARGRNVVPARARRLGNRGRAAAAGASGAGAVATPGAEAAAARRAAAAAAQAPGSFYEKPPPGLIKEDETKPGDCIPDVPGNEHAREFLAHAPTKRLWMPLGKEVKVMQSADRKRRKEEEPTEEKPRGRRPTWTEDRPERRKTHTGEVNKRA
nr:uncharacterized protein LOC131762403 [Kogia breviceps]